MESVAFETGITSHSTYPEHEVSPSDVLCLSNVFRKVDLPNHRSPECSRNDKTDGTLLPNSKLVQQK